MNIWQGNFPHTNDALDGYRFTCPSDAYEPQTVLGFRNMLGEITVCWVYLLFFLLQHMKFNHLFVFFCLLYIGNVWEWVEDWWTIDHILQQQEELLAGKSIEIAMVSDPKTMVYTNKTVPLNPRGPLTGTEKTKKGGSFLCHADFCYRYRPHARHKNTPDSATSNNGFRCAKSILP